MNRSVSTGDINGVVQHGKRLEEASLHLREAEAIVQSMDTSIGGSLPTETAENAIKNLTLSGGSAPGLGSSNYVASPPQAYQSSYSPAPAMRAPAMTPATGETG